MSSDNKILYLKADDPSLYKIIFDVIKEIIPETYIIFNNTNNDDNNPYNGFIINDYNYEKSICFFLKVDGSKLAAYKCSKNNYKVGIGLKVLSQVFKSLDDKNEFEINIYNNETERLYVESFNHAQCYKTTQSIMLMELEKSIYKLDPIKYDAEITINADKFHKACSELLKCGNELEITCTNNNFILETKGKILSNKISYINSNNNFGVNIQLNTTDKDLVIKGTYDLSNISKLKKCSGLNTMFKIYMKKDIYPLTLCYTIGEIGVFVVFITPLNKLNSLSDTSDNVN